MLHRDSDSLAYRNELTSFIAIHLANSLGAYRRPTSIANEFTSLRSPKTCWNARSVSVFVLPLTGTASTHPVARIKYNGICLPPRGRHVEACHWSRFPPHPPGGGSEQASQAVGGFQVLVAVSQGRGRSRCKDGRLQEGFPPFVPELQYIRRVLLFILRSSAGISL